MVRGTFSPARAWRPAVGPASTQTLGLIIETCALPLVVSICLTAAGSPSFGSSEGRSGVITEPVVAQGPRGEAQFYRGELVTIVRSAGDQPVVRSKSQPEEVLVISSLVMPISSFRRTRAVPRACVAGEYIGDCNFVVKAKRDGTYTAEDWCAGDARKLKTHGTLYANGPLLVARAAGSGKWVHGFLLEAGGALVCNET